MTGKIKYFTLIISLIIAGCATPQSLRASKPMLELASNKPSKKVAICISDTWANTTPYPAAMSTFPTNMQLREDGYSISINVTNLLGASWPVVIADVTDTPTGSMITYYQSMIGYGNYKDALSNCL